MQHAKLNALYTDKIASYDELHCFVCHIACICIIMMYSTIHVKYSVMVLSVILLSCLNLVETTIPQSRDCIESIWITEASHIGEMPNCLQDNVYTWSTLSFAENKCEKFNTCNVVVRYTSSTNVNHHNYLLHCPTEWIEDTTLIEWIPTKLWGIGNTNSRTHYLTECTTGAPTYSPTANPTTPTHDPSISPTLSPTISPTIFPTTPPSSSPTSHPTISPTISPTSQTLSPTSAPSNSPTSPPSISPTYQTSSPTDVPTELPTTPPSIAPTHNTLSPTNAPTQPPTSSPTFVPTYQTFNPTVAPTISPTMSPSIAPTPLCLTLYVNLIN
eukprot:530556_1